MAKRGYTTYYQNEYIHRQVAEVRQTAPVPKHPKPCFDCTAYGRPSLCNPGCHFKPGRDKTS